MVTGDRLAMLPSLLVLMLFTASWHTAGAVPSWDSPFFTADTSDPYIKDWHNSDVELYEDVPIGHKIVVLRIIAQPGDTVTVAQNYGTDEVQLSFDGTSNTERNVYIQSVIDREKTDSDIIVGLQLSGGDTYYLNIQVADVNDNVPTFDGNPGYQISLQMPENQLNDSLLILTATDQDVGATDSLTFSMDTGGHDDKFALSMLKKDGKPACQLAVTKELDYETMPMYRILVTVQDAPDDRGLVLSSSVRVFVNVEDRDDSPLR